MNKTKVQQNVLVQIIQFDEILFCLFGLFVLVSEFPKKSNISFVALSFF